MNQCIWRVFSLLSAVILLFFIFSPSVDSEEAIEHLVDSTQLLERSLANANPTYCRYSIEQGKINVTAVDQVRADEKNTDQSDLFFLSCNDFDHSDATLWLRMLADYELISDNLLSTRVSSQSSRLTLKLIDLARKSGRMLACAHLQTGLNTEAKAINVLSIAVSSAKFGNQMNPVTTTIDSELAFIKNLLSAEQPHPAPASCLTAGFSTPIPDDTWQLMQGRSWHESRGCPKRSELSLLHIPYFGFDGKNKNGQMIVAKSVAEEVLAVFSEIYYSKNFLINSIMLVDDFGGDDLKSMLANNTSSFNCRLTNQGRGLSEHAKGMAIDINPVQNPFVTRLGVQPFSGIPYSLLKHRTSGQAGLIRLGDTVTTAFNKVGWKWGGSWASTKDYQHFSKSGR